MDPATAFMADLDRRFRETSGLEERCDYSIFYSRLQPARLLVLGIKPGGRRDGSHQLASDGYYEDWSHEYVDMDYRIAAVMRPALMKALSAPNASDLRGVPKTNTFFHRAVGTDDFTPAEFEHNVRRCAPYLAEIIAFVGPEVIVLEGSGARDNLVRHHCQDVETSHDATILGLRRGSLNRFYRRETAFVKPLGRRVTLLTLGHPSQFGHLPTWAAAVEALSRDLGAKYLPAWGAGVGVEQSPVRQTPPAASVPSKRDAISQRHRPLSLGEQFRAAAKPPASFRYSPVHDFWRELVAIGPASAESLHRHLDAIGWRRPSRKELTIAVVRTDLVSMVKHGFAERTQI